MSRFPYNDILNLPYPNEEIERDFPEPVLYAAQFAPFSALTGHDEQVEETARLTQPQAVLEEDEKEILNRKFCFLKENLSKKPEISVSYFVKDSKKAGGSYHKKTGILKKILSREQVILLSDETKIPMKSICSLECPLFDENDINFSF